MAGSIVQPPVAVVVVYYSQETSGVIVHKSYLLVYKLKNVDAVGIKYVK